MALLQVAHAHSVLFTAFESLQLQLLIAINQLFVVVDAVVSVVLLWQECVAHCMFKL